MFKHWYDWYGWVCIVGYIIIFVAATTYALSAQASRPPVWTVDCFKLVSSFVDKMNRLRPDQTAQVKTLVDQSAMLDKYCMVYPR